MEGSFSLELDEEIILDLEDTELGLTEEQDVSCSLDQDV